MSDKKVFKYIDLFSGIGGFRKALDFLSKDLDIKTKCVAFSEIDKYATLSYKANYDTENEVEMGDIESFTKDISNINLLPDFDILFGWFPCQPFSMMGKKLWLNDERGGLFFSVLKIIDIKKPKYILLENVRNLFTHEHGKTYKKLKTELEKHGYNVKEDVFNTSDYGLPQHRRRLYIFANRNDLNDIEFNNSIVKESFPLKGKKSIKIHKSVLDDILDKDMVDEKYYLSEKIKPTILSNGSKGFHSNSEINRLIARPLTATMVKLHRACQDNYYSQEFLNSKDPIKYLSKKLVKEEEVKHRIRKLTPREALKLQWFPRDFFVNAELAGVSHHQIYKQAGNAVSVNTVYAVLNYILRSTLSIKKW